MYRFGSVTELNEYANNLIEEDANLSSLSVTGEISGLKVYQSSGHCYFSLKDDRSQISCAMFQSYFSRVNFNPEDGMKVRITGSAGIYSNAGRYQLIVYSMTEEGKGDIAEKVKEIYGRLNADGIFDPDHKKPLPVLPRRIGVISSAGGAVIHDIINTLNRRNPNYDLLLYPASVQGENCPADVIRGIKTLSGIKDIDVIIIARGGGSAEDLFGFNSEELARTIYDSDIPIISAVGHETDYTICDHAADLRAPTPTAAAELVLGRFDDLKNSIMNLSMLLNANMSSYTSRKRKELDTLKQNRALMSPAFYAKNQSARVGELKRKLSGYGLKMISDETIRLNNLKSDLKSNTDKVITDNKYMLSSLIDSIDLLGPSNVLKRGYSYVNKNGKTISSAADVNEGDEVRIFFRDGSAGAVIKERIVENG